MMYIEIFTFEIVFLDIPSKKILRARNEDLTLILTAWEFKKPLL
jgi:hypothetical protein